MPPLSLSLLMDPLPDTFATSPCVPWDPVFKDGLGTPEGDQGRRTHSLPPKLRSTCGSLALRELPSSQPVSLYGSLTVALRSGSLFPATPSSLLPGFGDMQREAILYPLGD